MRITKCVIPAAGFGTRLLPVTKSQPKEMVALCRKPVIQYVVEEAIGAGLKEILIVTGSRKRSIEDHFDYDSLLEEELARRGESDRCQETNLFARSDVQILYTRQSQPTGLADAVSLAKTFVDGEPFVVSLGDNVVISQNSTRFLSALIDTHTEKAAKATIALKTIELKDAPKYGIAKLESESEISRVVDVVEKPTAASAPSDLAIVGRYVFDPEIFDAIGETTIGFGGERQLTDSIKNLILRGEEVWGVKLRNGDVLHDIGTPYTYALAFVDMCLRDPEIGPSLREAIKDLMQT